MSNCTVVGLHVYLAYRDAPAALDWLERALGFETSMRWDDEHGGIAHAELRRDGVAVVVFSDAGADYERPAPRGDTVGYGVYLAVQGPSEVDALWVSALDAGAEPVWEPAWTDWGNYRARVRDLEGHEWTVAVHRPGQETASGRAW